jgi:hypothetical protein
MIFDFETKNSYSIRLEVTDTGGLTAQQDFIIEILDGLDYINTPVVFSSPLN